MRQILIIIMKSVFLLLLFLSFQYILPFGLCAQETQYLKPNQLKKYAQIAAKSGDIYTAIDYYEEYNKVHPNNTKVHHELGNLYYRERNYEKAAEFLNKAFKGKRNKYVLDQYYYANCLKYMGRYDEVEQEFKIFLKYLKKDKLKQTYGRFASEHIKSLEKIPEIQSKTNDVIITHLSNDVNKPHIEFNPIPYNDDKLIYGSLKEDELKYYDPVNDELPVRQFYLAGYNNGQWQDLGTFDDVINGHGDYNTGNGSFSYDGKRFYFTRCEKYSPTRIVCQIYRSALMHNEWQEPQLLEEPVNIPHFTSTMPSLGVSEANTDVLYFVSDRPEGRGGMDLWYSIYDDRKGLFNKVKSCGRKVNTEGNEITPYYNIETRTLYFSSDYLPGLGGYDVFKAEGSGRRFEEPENLGASINSSYDELYYILTPSRQKGFFTSNRPGGNSIRHNTCCDDIYEFVYRDFINIMVTGQVFGITDSTFFKSIEAQYKEEFRLNLEQIENDKDAIELLYNHPVSLYMVDKNTKQELFIKNDSTSDGNYWFQLEPEREYIIKVEDFNREEKSLSFNTLGINRSDTIVLDAIIVNTIPKEPIIVKNIYYEFGMSKLTKVAEKTIDNTIYTLMKTYPSIIVEISSHTDSVSSEEFNIRLSQDRAQSVVNYLISKGIERERLVAKGYGESTPIAPNTNPDGTDNPEGRAMNRRTEFKIIGSVIDKSDIIYEE